jgi:hypothetical protein
MACRTDVSEVGTETIEKIALTEDMAMLEVSNEVWLKPLMITTNGGSEAGRMMKETNECRIV